MVYPNKTSVYDDLRVRIIELSKTNDSLRTEIEYLRKELAEEVALKYKAYEKLGNISTGD